MNGLQYIQLHKRIVLRGVLAAQKVIPLIQLLMKIQLAGHLFTAPHKVIRLGGNQPNQP